MDYAHVHIILNHFPTIGTTIGLGLFIASFVTKSQELRTAGLVVMFLMALLGIPTYLTGSAAQGIISGNTGVSDAAIEAHQNAAMLAFTFMSITGILAWLGLWQYRRFSALPGWNLTAILLLGLLTVGLMVNTGNLGGEINHPEIRVEEQPTEVAGWRAAAQTQIFDRSWTWPAAETLHFIGMAMLFGVALMVNLRMVGLIKGVSFEALHRALPVGILGFGICLVTGMIFYLGNAERYIAVPTVGVKIFFIVLAGINVVYFTLFDQPWALKSGEDAPMLSKVVAVSTLVFLIGAMYYGRMIPFLE
jgi:uncharacterized membrane protein